MKTKIRIIILSVYLLAGISLFGCGGDIASIDPELIDKSMFTGVPCAAPCWHGLEIGKSNKSEVLSVLKTLSFVDPETIRIIPTSMPGSDSENWISGERMIVNCKKSGMPCLVLNVVEGRLRDIRSILNYKMTFAEVLEYLGSPDKVGFTVCCPEAMECEIQLVWIEKQIVLTSTPFLGNKGCDKSNAAFTTGLVDAGLEIGAVDYLPVEDIKNLVEDTDSVGDFYGVNSEK